MMIRRMIETVVLAALLAGTGCSTVVNNKTVLEARWDPVVLEGRIYVVDTKTGSIKKMDSAEVENAEIFVAEPDES